MKFVKDILTGIDKETYDNGRVLALLSFIVYFVLAFVDVLTDHTWSAVNFATGIATMAVGFGINLKLKSETEPK